MGCNQSGVPERDDRPKRATRQPLRLPMPVEDYVDAGTIVEQIQELSISSKAKKVANEGHVADEQANVTKNHVAFTNTMFAQVGGGALGAVGSVGNTTLSAAGQTAFTSKGPASSVFAMALEGKKDAGEKGKDKSPVVKTFDREIAQARLSDQVADDLASMQAKLTKVDDSVAKARGKCKTDTEDRLADGPHCIAGLQRLCDILEDRLQLKKLVAAARPLSKNSHDVDVVKNLDNASSPIIAGLDKLMQCLEDTSVTDLAQILAASIRDSKDAFDKDITCVTPTERMGKLVLCSQSGVAVHAAGFQAPAAQAHPPSKGLAQHECGRRFPLKNLYNPE